jgi:hyperosmotically inducible protein
MTLGGAALALSAYVAGQAGAAEDANAPPPPKQTPRIEAPKAPEGKPEEPSKPGATEPPSKGVVISLPLTVKLALMADPRLFPYGIDVTTEGPVTVLSGKIPSEADASLAVNVAMSVPGVTSVTNKLEIVRDINHTIGRKQDEAITAYVKDRFERSTTLKSAGFSVKTEEGIVMLSGKTRFQVIALEAAEAARQIPGVRAVRTDGIRFEAGD